ncbi:MAG: SAM-dependent methyltransferase [Gammaproteobacteria bacterium]|nr:MAG: SAM-dependent methyltransferase [Gammaproteobacteria bacterium]
MIADFNDAFHRHKQDCQILYEEKRWANADHLAGLAAECGLKAVMMALGMPVDKKSGSPRSKKYRVHLPAIWNAFQQFVANTHGAILALHLSTPSPFAHPHVWHVAQRYEPQSNFTKAVVDDHLEGLKEVENVYNRAKLAGFI